jgi:hypothetical protein
MDGVAGAFVEHQHLFLPFLSSNFLISNAFPASNVTAGMEARVAPDAPVKTKPGWISFHVRT